MNEIWLEVSTAYGRQVLDVHTNRPSGAETAHFIRADLAAAELAAARAEIERLKALDDDEVESLEAAQNALLAERLELRAEIERLRAERAWQPIATAPRDGTDILVCDRRILDSGHVVFWDDEFAGWGVDNTPIIYGDGTFTDWMPLPEAPR